MTLTKIYTGRGKETPVQHFGACVIGIANTSTHSASNSGHNTFPACTTLNAKLMQAKQNWLKHVPYLNPAMS